MNSKQFDRFFNFVGNNAINETTQMAKITNKNEFINDIMMIANNNLDEYGDVYSEMEFLAEKFWNMFN